MMTDRETGRTVFCINGRKPVLPEGFVSGEYDEELQMIG